MLADTLTRFLADHCAWKARMAAAATPHGYSRELWAGLAELGVIGALFPEDVGGFGGGAEDVAAVFSCLGKALVPSPMLGTLLAGTILAAAGDAEALAPVIAGEKILTFAHEVALDADGGERPAPVARKDGDGWRLTGARGLVPFLASADMIVVPAGGDAGPACFLVEGGAPGVAVRDYPLIDGGAAGELTLTDAPARLIATEAPAALEAALALGIVALAWEGISAMEVLRDATIEHLRTRKQFGVAIGKFQALQHRMATVALEIEQARSAAINATALYGADRLAREKSASAAKFTLGRVGSLVAEEAIQMHGGIGVTWELPAPHYAKRLIMIGHQLGDEDYHLGRYAALGKQE